MDALGIGGASGMSRGYLTPQQMDQLQAYQELTRPRMMNEQQRMMNEQQRIDQILKFLSSNGR
jgi:hypothetical protein